MQSIQESIEYHYRHHKAYLGATQRNLKDKVEEHKCDIKFGNLTTALVKRAYENDVRINWNEARIIVLLIQWS